MNRSPLFPKLLLGAAFVGTSAASARLAGADSSGAAPPPEPSADAPPPVNVVVHDAPPLHRTFTLEWNPVALFLDRFSVNMVIAPADHHAFVVNAFYTWASTHPYATNINGSGAPLLNASGNQYTLNVLAQSFDGFGGELGYRYYLDKGGPRGFFMGPSLMLAGVNATAGNGSESAFFDLGLAADVGYSAIVADRVVFTLGAGVQYMTPLRSIAPQQFPASSVANAGFQPRLLASVGYAF